MDSFKLLLLSFVICSTAFSQEWDPLGQSADYTTVLDRTRTSSAISAGSIHTEVEEERLEEEDYLIKLDFNISTWLSNEIGTLRLGFPWDYYEEGFFDNLAESNKPYQAKEFKIAYLGRKDVVLEDGREFLQTYLLKFYDIKAKPKPGQTENSFKLEGAEITLAVVPGMPVVGAVQIDVKGVYWGYDLIMGADLNKEAQQ